MRKSTLAIALTIIVILSIGASFALGDAYGPAPNAGDGVPDGSGLGEPHPSQGQGPAPNSGDGISDGSGF